MLLTPGCGPDLTASLSFVASDGDATAIPGAISTVHRYVMPLRRDVVWDRMTDVGAYRSWWAWLRRFDATELTAGAEWRCEVQPPLPYIVRFRIAIDNVEAGSVVRARVLGDVVGEATLLLRDLEPGDVEGDAEFESSVGCVASLHSSLAPGNTALRVMSRFAAPLARFGHDWVLDSGARQFISRAFVPSD